ncbi:MAG: dual specificity protein phosphatase [archaeon]|nr:dual specificity protein phosphatase [archaeon]
MDSVHFFEENGISHVVGINDRSVNTQTVTSISKENVMWYPIDDYPSAAEDLYAVLPETTRFIHEARVKGGSVYVHCAAGISRSSTVSIAYFTTWLDLDVTTCLRFLKAARPAVQPNPGFMKKLEAWQRSEERGQLRLQLLASHPDEIDLYNADMQHVFHWLNSKNHTRPLIKLTCGTPIPLPSVQDLDQQQTEEAKAQQAFQEKEAVVDL